MVMVLDIHTHSQKALGRRTARGPVNALKYCGIRGIKMKCFQK